MPLFNITFPGNAKMFYNLLTSMSSFDVLPTDTLDSSILNLNDNSDGDDDSSYDNGNST